MGEKKTQTVWFSLRQSLHCKSATSDVHNPKTRKQLSSILTRKPGGRSGCSRSISNLRDVIHGSKRQVERPRSCSPRSIGSTEFLNPIAHDVIFSNELKITPTMHYFNPSFKSCPPPTNTFNGVSSKKRSSFEKQSDGVVCHKCGEQFVQWEDLQSHHISKHAVTELVEGDSSRKIVEIICRSSSLKCESHCVRIDRVLKVHNMQKMLARFEEYRETVKINASKLVKKHPRCLADGNELLRFYGTTLTCSLVLNGCTSLCVSEKCCVCRIIRQGFSTKSEAKGGIGVFTTSTSGRAFECIETNDDGGGGDDDSIMRKALIVCRVIAGRVHRPLENIEEIVGQTGFDSLAGKVGVYSNIEELYLLDPKALLPCFVVICKR